jgi:hypothetical protein
MYGRMSIPRCLKIALVLTVALAGGLARSGTTTAPDPDTDPAAFIDSCRKFIKPWQNFQLLPACKISDVISFTEDQGFLIADWPLLHNGPVTGRIPLSDLPGDAIIVCHNTVKYPASLYPMFEYYDLSQPDFVCRHLQIISSATHLDVVQDSESVSEYRSVSLLENIGQPDGAAVTLRVQDHGQNLVFAAQTINELRHEHPNEFEHYLRPMFHQFHQEHTVFWMDDRIDWQALADEYQPGADLKSHVAAILAQLNSADFPQRQQAQKSLESLGQRAALVLHAADRHAWTPEQSTRVDAFLAEYFTLSDAQSAQMGRDPDFLLDCLTNDDLELRAAALNRLQRVLGKKIEYNLDQSPAQRAAAIEQLRRQLDLESQNAQVSK